MKRNQFLRRIARLMLYGIVAFALLKTGQYVSPHDTFTLHSTNAFLFLFGLSSAIALLSPNPRRLRYR